VLIFGTTASCHLSATQSVGVNDRGLVTDEALDRCEAKRFLRVLYTAMSFCSDVLNAYTLLMSRRGSALADASRATLPNRRKE